MRPSSSFFTIQLAANRTWDGLAHHLLVLTEGSSRVYDELFERGAYPSDPPIYVNATCVTDLGDAPAGCSNPFVVIGAPPLNEGEESDRDFESRYADQMIARLERSGLPGLGAATVARQITGPSDWRDRFGAFRGAIYGLGNRHNVLGGSFRPLNYRADVPGLYFVGGGVQPGAGMPMVVQSGKITAQARARPGGLAPPAGSPLGIAR
ncbi:MAG: hypothetical protein WKF75_02310 [Singulisphaera sp.]